jgi:hypothetical protein
MKTKVPKKITRALAELIAIFLLLLSPKDQILAVFI